MESVIRFLGMSIIFSKTQKDENIRCNIGKDEE
jgi:hypothetical protein